MKQIETTKGHILAELRPKQPTSALVIPEGFKIVGKWSALTEQRAAMMIEKTDNPFWYGDGYLYIDYTNTTNCFKTALESFASLMHAIGIYLVNPMGSKPKYTGRWVEMEGIDNTYNEFVTSKKYDEWQQYQKAVCDPIILFKPNK